ncbi:uncharacterized protein PGTG_18636 [Puccinia graminis f. sp. tritici CRL 75-36-700-3]|uniref:Uncharacterized protein n=1 Tax=Puccinia graminis f. sp. tritici (strain CRL 75-36-700-3 / race SCCL) TaxID=418459 RepID=E3L7W2_PUCGT|nr:uncharacterized protein PGTG_18636 [Puccinia graminis f. sp. tritici CRL 75-36-700-3]EFP92637.2 hypothetical protein PGTG_18636 [Puccinia graminis f. sp. tritici CRL 75-36-700-3]
MLHTFFLYRHFVPLEEVSWPNQSGNPHQADWNTKGIAGTMEIYLLAALDVCGVNIIQQRLSAPTRLISTTHLQLIPRSKESRRSWVSWISCNLAFCLSSKAKSTLSLALDLPGLRDDPAPKLALILRIQAELDCTLDQITYLVATLSPDRQPMSNRTDDNHLKEFKSYRLCRLRTNFEGILSEQICEIFETADNIIKQMELSSAPSNSSCSDIASLKKSLDLAVCGTSDTIQSIADCFQASELAIAQDSWRDTRLEIEEQHRSILKKLDRSTRLKRKSDHFVAQSVIQLARLSLPIFKLSKIFFAKFSERGLTRERFPIHTAISSDQINIIAESVDSVAERLHEIETFLDCANRRNGRSDQVITAAAILKGKFESPLFLVLLHFIPLIPDTEGLHRQKHYQDWCVTWNIHMALAIHNFILAAKSYTNARP